MRECEPAVSARMGSESGSADDKWYDMTAWARPSFTHLCRLDEWVERASGDIMGLEVLAHCLRAGGVRRWVNGEGCCSSLPKWWKWAQESVWGRYSGSDHWRTSERNEWEKWGFFTSAENLYTLGIECRKTGCGGLLTKRDTCVCFTVNLVNLFR